MRRRDAEPGNQGLQEALLKANGVIQCWNEGCENESEVVGSLQEFLPAAGQEGRSRRIGQQWEGEGGGRHVGSRRG